MKNKYFLIGLLVIIFIVIYGIYLIFSSREETSVNPKNVPTPASFNEKNNVPSQSFEKQMQYQSQSDHNFGQWQTDTYTTYPWYNKLPLQSDRYFVYFDLEKKKFIGSIYAESSERDTIINQVLTTLKSYGINTDNYQFEWH